MLALIIGCTGYFFVNSGFAADSGSSVSREYKIKAALIYNFLKFTEWPEGVGGGSSTVNICILGDDPFGDALAPIEARKIDNKQVKIRKIWDLNKVGKCNALFVGYSERNFLPKVVDIANKYSVLTIGEVRGFTEIGGTIGFVEQSGKIRFTVNMQSLKKANVKISSKLLELAITTK